MFKINTLQKINMPEENRLFFFLSGLFILYAFFLPAYTDPSFLAWAQYIYKNGLGRIYETGSNYLPLYHYCLWIFGKLQSSPEKIAENIKYIRLFSLAIEFIAVYFVLGLVNMTRKKEYNLLYAAIILLNVAYFYDTMAFGQIDGMLTTFILISFCFAIVEKPTLSLLFYLISLNCKFQAILFAPLLALILLPAVIKRPWKKNAMSVLIALFLQFLILLPFILSGQLSGVRRVVTDGTVNLMPFLAPSANSLWRWLIPGNGGVNTEVVVNGETVQMLDNGLFLGITYHHWGLLLFCISSAMALYPLVKHVFAAVFRRKPFLIQEHIPEILLTAALLDLCFYFFNTQMHSRYSHYALIFIATYSIIRRDYFVYILFSIVEFLSLEHDFRFFRLRIYDTTLFFNAYFITGLYLATIVLLFSKLYRDALLKPANAIKRNLTYPNIIYFSFAIFYFIWVLVTYRNIIHMDMITIVSTKVRHLFEHSLLLKDLVYEPIFPCFISLMFTFVNAEVFHLNTVLETAAGSVCLILLGFYYLKEMNAFSTDKRQKILFAVLTGFIVFGLHKWEASFTSFFSFAVFFNLGICFYNYFFIVKYIDRDRYAGGKYHIPLLIFSYLLVIAEAPAYFYGYMLSVTALLFLIRWFGLVNLNKRRWTTILTLNVLLLLFTIALTTWLSKNPAYSQYSSTMSIGGFLKAFFQRPVWIILFYLVANSGPFLGEADGHTGLSAICGLLALIAYGWAIYQVIKRKDKRMLVPLALIFYNIISYGFITMGRYVFNSLEYGSSSRYTAFNLSGVLGLATILFFYIPGEKRKISRIAGPAFLAMILASYLYVDNRQLKISPYRTAAFLEMKKSLLTGENLGILQDKPEISLDAIGVLKKYRLNVYYNEKSRPESIDLDKVRSVVLASGSPSFDNLRKTGFYGNENGITWTDGKSSINLDNCIETKDSLVIQLNTYLPSNCKGVSPEISFSDTTGKAYLPARTSRKGDVFFYFFDLGEKACLQKIHIQSDTINAFPDKRVLSFPFMSLEIRKG